jgi:hypothetical protein
MKHSSATYLLIAFLAIVCQSGYTQSQRKERTPQAPAAQKSGLENAAPTQAQPSTPLPPAPRPSRPAVITYQHGGLTIVGKNSTLGDILREVGKQTGAVLDIPLQANERVFGRFGPGPVRAVLASLLNGSDFNYVLQWSDADPSLLTRVTLWAKGAAFAVNSSRAPTTAARAPGQGTGQKKDATLNPPTGRSEAVALEPFVERQQILEQHREQRQQLREQRQQIVEQSQ